MSVLTINKSASVFLIRLEKNIIGNYSLSENTKLMTIKKVFEKKFIVWYEQWLFKHLNK